MINKKSLLYNEYSLYVFSFFISILTYGFALTNYSLTVDSESPAFPDYSMSLGRWGTNLIRYRIFEGHLPYFTLLLGLLFLSLSAVELTKIFRLKNIYSFIFCALFLSVPQHAYQLAFTMQADAVPIGFYCSILGVHLFISNISNLKEINSVIKLLFSCLLITFTIAIYQALVFIPVITYLVFIFININEKTFVFKYELKRLLCFILLMVISLILYYLSVKLFCPPIEDGYLSSYTAGGDNNRFVDFYNLWIDNIRGDFYYGDKTFLFASISSLFLIVSFAIEKKNFFIKLLCLLTLLITPFFISFFITNGSNPPRLYVSSTIIFGFLITYLIMKINISYIKQYLFIIILLVCSNIYLITNLFYSNYKIFNHDVTIAKKIETTIQNKYPDFDSNTDYVYFYGALPESNYEKLKLPNSEVFGGSLFAWDGGNNWRIINFFRFNDIAYFRFLDDKRSFDLIKDSIPAMPQWPSSESVKKINNVVVVKIGSTPGALLPLQQK